MIIYITGPISSCFDTYKDNFKNAETMLRSAGHIVLNPAVLPDNLPYESYFPICFAMIDAADGIYLLKGWEKSMGANHEYGYAVAKNKKIGFEEEL